MTENVNVNVENKEEVPAKLIFKYGIAKALVEEYHHEIIGLKTNKQDKSKIVFVFRDSISLRDDMQKIIKERRKHFAEVSREDAVEKPMQED